MSYLVVRLVPDSPVDGGTFGTYLDGLQIEVYPANASSSTPALGSTSIDQSNLMLVEVPWLSGVYVASVSKVVEQGTPENSGNYGSSLEIEDANGVAFNAVVVCPNNTTDITSGTYVTDIPLGSGPTVSLPAGSNPTVSLNQSIPAFIAAGSVVTFYYAYNYNGSPNINVDPSSASFSLQMDTTAKATNSTTLNFANTSGIAVGMQVSGAGIPASVTVTAIPNSTTITLSSSVTVANKTTLQFLYSLNSGIVQHTEPLTIGGPINFYIPVPVSVATAVIPISSAPPVGSYLDITVVATRNGIQIPLPDAYYNVIVTTGAATTPDQYQTIPPKQTAFYISLPPPPLMNGINLVIPSDGSAPTFDPLVTAMQNAIANDPYFNPAPDISMLIQDQCTRMAYDIVWSQQSYLPAPPDPLESLYTNPPNPGGSAVSSNNNNGTNGLETDRQKFEGSLNSFYSTPNASAQRLTKFVAAASAAIFCEATSLSSTSALLEFPVDPSAGFAASVESELMVEGLGLSGPAGIHFGIPAAFFYALGATLDQSTTASQRFQLATGDTIERLLQLLSLAENANVIEDSEGFYNSGAGGPITSFQAARRLAALGVSTSSNCPSATVFSGTPLAALVGDWLTKTDPTSDPPPNPPLTYENTDFNIWSQQIAGDTPQGYLYLDLDALTQGYIIPKFPASPSIGVSSGDTLTFSGIATGIGAGMPVSGAGIASGTTVKQVSFVTTVTLGTPLSAGGVKTSDTISFSQTNSTVSAVSASPNVDIASGSTITFIATTGTAGITSGMQVSGPGIAANTLVTASQTVTTVTLSAAVTGSVSISDNISFNSDAAPFEAVTTAACAKGGTTLTFVGSTSVASMQPGMTVYGVNIPSGTTIKAVNPGTSTVTINGAGASGVIPANTVITFVSYPPPVTLADQIFVWLSSTTNPPTANPVIATLKGVTAAQWTNFFSAVGNQNWLPPFTQPVPPGASRPSGPQSAGYVSMRIRAFIRAVQQFFTVSSIATSQQLPAPGSPPVFALPTYDPITLAAQILPPVGSFAFGKAAIAGSDLSTAVQSVFPGDNEAQAWLSDAITAINELYQVALPPVVPNPSLGSYSLPNPASLATSVVEALYARGFRSAAGISSLPSGDFQQALTGTVAYDFAGALHANAQNIAPSTPSTGLTGGSFQPINPDGTLVNCIPPPCLAPTNPIAYLQELLKLSPASTCADPWATPAKGQNTLGDTIAGRRGPLGTLLASCANLETPLPLIDIVNENLESLAAAVASSSGSGTSLNGVIYNTAADELAGFALCNEDQCKDKQHGCHKPEAIYAALPEYSTPATPVSANQSVEPAAFNALKQDFSACSLPYSQALDVSRTYMSDFGSCRFEAMRTFRKCITEFALDPDNSPSGFQSFLWRYPVRIDIAIEYLGITPEEYTTLFDGAPVQPCAEPQDKQPAGTANAPTNPGSNPATAQGTSTSDPASRSVGRSFNPSALSFTDSDGPVTVAKFLEVTCLSYCEFLELWNSGFAQSADPVPSENAAVGTFPKCEPCCLKDYELQLPRGDVGNRILIDLMVVIRLWRKLRALCNAGYTFDQLYDIATVFGLFEGGSINRDFIRQLAAFQMLRDQFRLPLVDPADRSTGGTGAARTHILALWVGASAKKWTWAVKRLLEGVEAFAKSHYDGKRQRGEFAAHVSGNLDALSSLAGFNPASSSSTNNDTWNSTPGCTLRFAEVLAKMCASDFRIGELLYLFNAQPLDERRDPFAQQDPNEALNDPLDLPESSHEHGLWKLREYVFSVGLYILAEVSQLVGSATREAAPDGHRG